MDGFFANNPLGEDPDGESMLGDNAMGVARGASFLMGDDPNKDSVKPTASSPIGDAPMGEKPKENPFGDDPLGLLSGVNPLGGNIKPDTSFGGGTNVAKPSALGPNPLGDDPLGLLSGINPLGGNIKPDTSFGGGTTIAKASSLGPNPLGPNPLGLNPLGENPLGPDPIGLGAKEEAAPAPAPEPVPEPVKEEPKEIPLGGIISLEDDFGDGVLGGIISLSDPTSFSSGIISGRSSFGSGVVSSDASYDDENASSESSGEASNGSSLESGVISSSYSYDDDDNSIQIPYGDGTLDSTLEGSSSYYNNGSSLGDDDDFKPLGENVNDDVFSLNYAGLDAADDDPLGLMSSGASDNNQLGEVPSAPKNDGSEGMDPLKALLLAGGNPFGDNAKNIAPDLSFGKEALKPKHFEPMKASGPRVHAENVQANNPLGDNPFGKDIVPDFSFGKEALKPKRYVPKKPFEESGTLANEMMAVDSQGDVLESEEQPLAVNDQDVFNFEGKAVENVSILEKDTRELHFEEENMLGYNAMGVDRSASFLMGADPNEVVQKEVEDFTLGDAPMGVAPKAKAAVQKPATRQPVKVPPLGENALGANPLGENVKPDVSFDDATTVASASGLGPNPLGPDPLGLLAAENKKNESRTEEKVTVSPAVSEPAAKKPFGENPLGLNPLGPNPLGGNIRPDNSFGGNAAVRPTGFYGSDTLIQPAKPVESETLIKPASPYGSETLVKPASPYDSETLVKPANSYDGDTLIKPAAKPVNLYEDLEPAKPAPVSSFAAAHSTTSSLYDDLDEPNEEEEEEEDSDERFCPECGMPMMGRDSFCNRCGKKVEPVGKREYERMRAKKSGSSTTSRSGAGSSSRGTGSGGGFRNGSGGNGGSYGGNGGFGGYDDDEYGRAPIPTSRVRQAPEIPVKLIVLGAITAVMVIVAIVCTVLAISASKKDAITVLQKQSVTNGHNVTETITFYSTGNKIRSITEEMVIDATGMSQDDINFNKEHWDKTYADIAKASFIDYNVSQNGNEIVMHLAYNFLDNKDNITTMSEMGLFKLGGNKTEAGNGDYIALKKTLKDLQKTGYVLQEN